MSEKQSRPDAELQALAEFYATHDVSDAIDGGDVVTPEPMVTTSLRLPGAVVDRLRAEAAARGIRYTSLIREVLVSHVASERPSSHALASRLDAVEREYGWRLQRLEDAQRRISDIASEHAPSYDVGPDHRDDAESSDDAGV